MAIKNALEDVKVKKLLRITESIKGKVNITELVKELKNMLLTREYRTFDKRVLDQYSTNIANWAGEVATHQARIADILIVVTDHRFTLNKLLTLASNRILSNYSSGLKGGVGEKKAQVENILYEPVALLSDLDKLIKIIAICDKELERSYYNSQLIKGVIEITTRPDRSG